MLAIINQIFHRSSIVIINQISIIITIPYIASIFTQDNFGIFSQAIVFIQIIWILSEWGIGNYSIDIFPKSQKKQFTLFLEINFMILLLLTLFSILLFIIISFIDTGIDKRLFIILLLSFIFGGLNPLWYFQAQLRPKVLILPTIFSRLTFLVFVFSFIKNDQDMHLYFIFNGLIFFFIFCYSIIILINEGLVFKLISINKIYFHIKSSLHFFLSSLFGNQFASIWMFIFTLNSSPYLIAIYAIGDHFLRAINMGSNIIANVIWANFKKKSLSRNQLFYVGVSILLFVPIIWIAIKPLIEIFFNESYGQSILICRYLLIIWGINSLIKIYMYPLFAVQNTVNWVNLTVIKFGILHLISIVIWQIFFRDLWSMIFMMIFVLLFELIFFFYKYWNN